MVQWAEIVPYIIPAYELCNVSVGVCSNGRRLLGYPISLENEKYERNRFTFNICFVLDEKEDARPFQRVLETLAKFLRTVEQEDEILSREEKLAGMVWAGEEGYAERSTGAVRKIMEGVLEDLNDFGECMIHIGGMPRKNCPPFTADPSGLDDVHTLNLKLFLARSEPSHVHGWDVPLLKRHFNSSNASTTDLILNRILPYINGINHVQAIAELADTDAKLTKIAIRSLLYYDCVLLLDIFTFSAVYAPTPDIDYFLQHPAMQDECRKYVVIDPSQSPWAKKEPVLRAKASGLNSKSSDISSPKRPDVTAPTRATIIILYRSLKQGLTVREWCSQHSYTGTNLLANVDVRRLLTFGVIKGFLYRQHRYVLALDPQLPADPELEEQEDPIAAHKAQEKAWRQAAMSSGWATPPVDVALSSTPRDVVQKSEERRTNRKLLRMLDGKHSMDRICTELHISEKEVTERIETLRVGEVVYFYR